MKKILAIQSDALNEINIETDTTLSLALEAVSYTHLRAHET